MRSKPLPLPGRQAVMSLDLEEDYGGSGKPLQYDALAVLPDLVSWFESHRVPLTIFVSGNLLKTQGQWLKALPASVDFHCHGYSHPIHAIARQQETRQRNIRDGLRAFEAFFKRRSLGYRAPFGYLKEDDFPVLVEEGIRFDSSFFPGIHVSGFHLFRSDRPRWYPDSRLIEIPISAHPIFRMPMGFSYMKLFGSSLFSLPQKWGMGLRPLVFDFHLHDMVATCVANEFSPWWRWVYRGGKPGELLKKLTDWISLLQNSQVEFISMTQLYERLSTKV